MSERTAALNVFYADEKFRLEQKEKINIRVTNLAGLPIRSLHCASSATDLPVWALLFITTLLGFAAETPHELKSRKRIRVREAEKRRRKDC